MRKYIRTMFIAAMSALTFAACETISVDSAVTGAPVITSFSPMSAPAGAEVVVSGQFLNNVTAAKIGDVAVSVVEKVSDSRLTIKISTEVTKGKITLTNPAGSGSSEQDFTSSFAVPAVNSGLLQNSAEMWDNILVSGENLNSVKDVLFTSDGYDVPHAATIVQQQDDELIVRVPYVEGSSARITFTYYDGGDTPVETSKENAPVIEVIKYTPTFDAYVFERTAVGKSITLTGKNLDFVEEVTIKENGEEIAYEAVFSKTAQSLSITIPAGDFEDGDHEVTLTASWFEGNESLNLSENFVVYVPYIRIWENISLYCQGRTADNPYRSFFSPETGILYQNSVWRTELDPVAATLNGAQWGSGNKPKEGMISDDEYNSVVPYFFFSAVNAGQVQLNSPANSNGQLKNFYINATNPEGTNSDANRVPGGNTSLPGTPIFAYRYLDPSNTAELALINKVKNGEVEQINEETFPIDVTAMTVGGISITSARATLNTDYWCKDYVLEPLRETLGYQVDAVILVMYYKNYGYNADNLSENIKRLGFIHIKTMDWRVYNASTPNYGCSIVTFDCLWQKYDYDYSKL